MGTLEGVKCRAQIPSMDHHTWPHVTFTFFFVVVLNHGFIFNITIRIVLSCVIVKVVCECLVVVFLFLFFANSTAVMLATSLCSWLLFVHIRQYLCEFV